MTFLITTCLVCDKEFGLSTYDDDNDYDGKIICQYCVKTRSQSRMHHDDIPGTVVSDNTGGEWQNLRLPLDYETKPKERFFMCKSCAGTFFAMWKEKSGLCLTCDIERDLTKKEPIC